MIAGEIELEASYEVIDKIRKLQRGITIEVDDEVNSEVEEYLRRGEGEVLWIIGDEIVKETHEAFNTD